MLSFCLWIYPCFTSTASAAPKDDTVWVFDCQHFGSGKYRYMVAGRAIKIINTSNGAITLAKAPLWQVSCYSESEKLEWFAAMDRYNPREIISAKSIIKTKGRVNFTVSGKDKILGLSCLKYQLTDGTIIWVAEGLKTAPEVNDLISRHFLSPSIGAIPLKLLKPEGAVVKATAKSESQAKLQKAIPWLSAKNLQGKPSDRCYLSLLSWKQMPYKESDFAYPSNYKRTEKLNEIIISQKNREAIEDLVRDLSR